MPAYNTLILCIQFKTIMDYMEYQGLYGILGVAFTRRSTDDKGFIRWQYNQPMTIQTLNDNTDIKSIQ